MIHGGAHLVEVAEEPGLGGGEGGSVGAKRVPDGQRPPHQLITPCTPTTGISQ